MQTTVRGSAVAAIGTALGALAIALAGTAAEPSPAVAAGDKDCSDFENQKQAQGFFQNAGPGDPHNLDADGDGKACESLPCPCAGAGKPRPKPKPKPKPGKKKNRRFGEAHIRSGPIFANTQCGKRKGLRVRPVSIQISCGSSAFKGFELSWSDWGRKQAHSTGLIFSRDCATFPGPAADCNATRTDPGQVRLYRPRYCRFLRKNVWTRVEMIWEPTVPHETNPTVLQSNCSFFEPVRFRP